ncbi:MAG: AEC family transporter [Butyricicoccus sp.]|nr:AEC family transporter [Butyricicoccus sp.]
MFANSIIVFQQIVVMFFIMLLGYYIFRKGVFNNETTKSMSGLLNRYVTPCTLIRSFQREFDPALARTFFITLLCAAATFVISVTVARLVYRPQRAENYADRRVCTILTNDGFMALPLLSAMFGASGVFLGSAHICCMAVVLWTYCVWELSHGRETMNARNVIFNNPGLIGAVLGMLVFVSPVKLPGLLYTAIDFVGDLNTPLAMICLGCFIAQVDLKECFADKSLWGLSALHLLAVPLVVMAILLFVPVDQTAKLTLLVGAAAPTAIASAMFSQVYGADFLYATRAIALTTILSVVTLPGLIALMEMLMRAVG